MLYAITLGDMMEFFLKCGLIFAGLYLIIVLTPKLANFIDKKRAQKKDPYDGVPNPARVDDESIKTENDASESENPNTESNTKE